MNHWPFIVAAYAIAVGGIALLSAASYRAMKRAEKRADAITRRD